jgi:hypothetical protein
MLHGCLFFEASHFPSVMEHVDRLAAQNSLPFSDIFFPVFNTDKGNPLLTSMIPTQKGISQTIWNSANTFHSTLLCPPLFLAMIRKKAGTNE